MGMSDTIIESIILTILAICWVGPIIGVMDDVMGAIMNGSVSISLKTVLKKVMVIVMRTTVGTCRDCVNYFRYQHMSHEIYLKDTEYETTASVLSNKVSLIVLQVPSGSANL